MSIVIQSTTRPSEQARASIPDVSPAVRHLTRALNRRRADLDFLLCRNDLAHHQRMYVKI